MNMIQKLFVMKVKPFFMFFFFHMSLSKCSPLFGGQSVVKILASWFEFDNTLNPGSKNTSWSQLSDRVSCLLFLWQTIVLCQETVGKRFFWQQLNCVVQLKNFFSPIIYDAMVECQWFLKWWGHQLYNYIGHKKNWNLVLGTEILLGQHEFFNGLFCKIPKWGHAGRQIPVNARTGSYLILFTLYDKRRKLSLLWVGLKI